jgi:hypothetical protein
MCSCRWEDNIKIKLKEIVPQDVNSADSEKGAMTGFSEYGNEPYCFIEGGEILHKFIDYQFRNKVSAP